MSRRITHHRFTTIALASMLSIAVAPGAIAATRVAQMLTATSRAPGARGHADLVLKTVSQGRLRVIARGLAARSSFDVVIGGIKVARLTTNAGGAGKAKLSTHPRAGASLLGTDPRGQSIAVRDDQGDDVLDGEMPDDGQDGGDVTCCIPGGTGSECNDTTADECVAAGGTVSPAVSCLPDPCNSTPPGGEVSVVCCVADSAGGAFADDDPEVECEESSSMADCANAGGTVVQATSCDPDPCAPVPPPQVGVCCVPDGNEAECEILTPDHCAQENGTPNAVTSCEPNPCGGGTTDGGDTGDSGDGSSGGSDHVDGSTDG